MESPPAAKLSRFLLALKVVLRARLGADAGVDEIDTALAARWRMRSGTRLARLATKVQVMAVTHAPQVAARASQHLLISKDALDKGSASPPASTRSPPTIRREEIARMLAGAEITAEARGRRAPCSRRRASVHRHSGAMRSIEPGISRFRVWSFGPSRNDDLRYRSTRTNHSILDWSLRSTQSSSSASTS